MSVLWVECHKIVISWVPWGYSETSYIEILWDFVPRQAPNLDNRKILLDKVHLMGVSSQRVLGAPNDPEYTRGDF